MPDFAKALKPLRTKTASLSLSQQMQFLRATWKGHPGQTAAGSRELLPPGTDESTPLGSHFAVRKAYPHDYSHGKVRLSRLSTPDLESLIILMREKAAAPPRERIVFLDTETTGIQGGAGMCPFLVGLGFFVDDEFHVLQYFIRDFDEEPSMLHALGEALAVFELVVTYNGAAFDIPLLESRFTLARLPNPFQSMSHFDLLFTARRLWRNGHGSCRLTALEREIISFLRGPDVPGALIPRAYFDFVQQRPAPLLAGVFTHNVDDVVSLAALTVQACDRVVLPPAPLDDALDLYSLGRVLESSAEWRRSISLYEMAVAGGLPEDYRRKALENLAVVYRRAGEHERSLAVCAELMEMTEFSMPAYEGAAIYYEHVRADYETALHVLERGLARTESKRSHMLLKARWERLQQKVLRYEEV